MKTQLLFLNSTSLSSDKECDFFIDKTLSSLKQNNHLKILTNKFIFVHVNNIVVEKLINKMNVASGAGLSLKLLSMFVFNSFRY